MKLIALSVHYRYPELLRDHWWRFSRCESFLREETDVDFVYGLVLHADSDPSLERLATELSRGQLSARVISVGRPAPEVSGGGLHARGLAAAYHQLVSAGDIEDDDLIAVVDHDCHPVHDEALAASVQHLAEREDLGGMGVPQWHRGHCYLHPSFAVLRARLVREMGVEWAFHSRRRGGGKPHDTCEGFTRWCTARGVPLSRMRVNATLFPWERWDSQNVPGRGAALRGEHGESVVVGHVMRYGLEADKPLVSHMWALPLRRAGRRAFSRHDPTKVWQTYLDEPFVGGPRSDG